MIRKSILFMAMSLALFANAQTAQWLLHPNYDNIQMNIANNGDLLLFVEKGDSTILYTLDGERTFGTTDIIMPFKCNVATVVSRQDNEVITGFIDSKGAFKPLPNVNVTFSHPYFNDGLLLAHQDNAYIYFDTNGNIIRKSATPYDVCYPAVNNSASFLTYDNIDKVSDPYYSMFFFNEEKGINCVTMIDGKSKNFDYKKLNFLSNVGANGKAVAIIDGKVFWYDPVQNIFTPMLSKKVEETKESKRMMSLSKNFNITTFQYIPSYIINNEANGKDRVFEICVIDEKKNKFILKFDYMLRLIKDSNEDVDYAYEEPVPVKKTNYNSKLTMSEGGNGKYELLLDWDKLMLPAQFDEVSFVFNDCAVVKKNGNWGIVKIDPESTVSIELNGGNGLSMPHYMYKTDLLIKIPLSLDINKLYIDNYNLPNQLKIDETSLGEGSTRQYNFLKGECVVYMPQDLTGEYTTITLDPLCISYDGIVLNPIDIAFQAKHYRYISLTIPDNKSTVDSNGNLRFECVIEGPSQYFGGYSYETNVTSENKDLVIKKVNIESNAFTSDFEVSNLAEGPNELMIEVIEEGCPPINFLYTVTYTKPAPRTNQKAQVTFTRKPDPKPAPAEEEPIYGKDPVVPNAPI